MLTIIKWVFCFVSVFCFKFIATSAEKNNDYDAFNPPGTHSADSNNQALYKEGIEHKPHLNFKIDERGNQDLFNGFLVAAGNLILKKGTNSKPVDRQIGRGILVKYGTDIGPEAETSQHLVTRTPYTKTVTRKTYIPGETATHTYGPKNQEGPLLLRGGNGGVEDWSKIIPGSQTYVTTPTRYETHYKELPQTLNNLLGAAQGGPSFSHEEKIQNPQPLTWIRKSESGRPGTWVEETTQKGKPSSWQSTSETGQPGKWVEETETETTSGNSGGGKEEAEAEEDEEGGEEEEEQEEKEEKGSPSTYVEESETSSSGGSSPGRKNKRKKSGGSSNSSSSSSSSSSSWSRMSGGAKGTSSSAKPQLLAIKRKRVIHIHGKRASKSAARKNSSSSSARRSASGRRSVSRSKSLSRSLSKSRSHPTRGRRSP